MTKCNTWCIYVLLCSDNSFYCGITTNLEKRLKQHNGELKGGAKYTRGRRPCQVIYTKKAMNRSIASKQEFAFKKLNRKQKESFLSKSQLCGTSSPAVTTSGSTHPSSVSESSEEQSSSTLASPPETSWSPAASPASETP